jgi:hypothetical protein
VKYFYAWKYAEAAKHEATAVGVITYVTEGRSRSYDYEFQIDGVRLIQDSDTCKTALTPQGCKVGSSVLVYYAHLPVLIARLQEFGAASRETFVWGSFFVFIGLLLFGLFCVMSLGGEEPGQTRRGGLRWARA